MFKWFKNRKKKNADEDLTALSQEPAAMEQEPTAPSQKPTAMEQECTALNQDLTSSEQEPADPMQKPAAPEHLYDDQPSRTPESTDNLIPTEMDNPEAAKEPEYYNPMLGVEAPDGTPYKRGGSVTFENVSFTYPDGSAPVLRNISFDIHKGEFFSIVGAAGSGKSTLARLISRFYDATEGTVKVDGIDVRKYKEDALRERVLYIAPGDELLTGLLPENAAADKPGAEILVLDIADEDPQADAFAALCAVLKENFRELTKIILSQTVSQPIMDSDRIAVLDAGAAAGCGTHKELLENCAVYRNLGAVPQNLGAVPQEDQNVPEDPDTEILDYMDPNMDTEH